MKTWRSLLLAYLALSVGLLCVPEAFSQSKQQYVDDDYFNIYVYASANSDGSFSASASDPEPDSDLEYDSYTFEQPTWSLSGGNYRNSGQGSSFSAGSLPLGASYDASFEFVVVYYYENPYAGGDSNNYCDDPIDGGATCRAVDNIVGDVSLYIPAPPPVISSIDPSYALQGAQGTLTVSGSNFANYSGDQLALHFSGGGSPFTLTSTQTPCTSGCTATFSYDVSGYAAGPSYQVWLSNNEAESEPVSFPIYFKSLVTSGPAPFSCAVSSNQAAGSTSIVPSGINLGISGNFSVSFGGPDFAAINPTVAYGPYSTPESIAASMAALITRNYAQYGLTAKAFGRNVIYSGTATTASGSGNLGLVSPVFSGNGGASSSFVANPSSSAPNEAEMACESAPPPPQTSVCDPDPGPRGQINVPATITRARMLLSQHCGAVLTSKIPGYTTTKLFSTLNRAIVCQYPNSAPTGESGAYAYTHTMTNTIDLLPDFYTAYSELNGNRQPLTLFHEGIHLLGRGQLPDTTVQADLGLPQTNYDTDNITRYIAGGCNP